MDKTTLHYSPSFLSTSFPCDIDGLNTQKLYLLNGVPEQEKYILPEGVRIEGNRKEKGILIELASSVMLEIPLQLINVRQGNGSANVVYSNTIRLEPRAQAKLIICDHTFSLDEFVTQSAFDIELAEGAQLEMVVMQNEHNRSQHRSDFVVSQASGSVLNAAIISLHGGKIENFIKTKLQEQEAQCNVSGLFLADAEQHITTNVFMQHLVPHCSSSQLFKGILKNNAVGRFNGRIFVAKDAQKTEAYQANHNLLLDRTAKIYTQPQLEIYADDVKCSHGATIGRLNEDIFFYLRSRGIGRQEALLLQQLGFANDVLNKIPIVPLRERITTLVEKRLRGELSHCENCNIHCC